MKACEETCRAAITKWSGLLAFSVWLHNNDELGEFEEDTTYASVRQVCESFLLRGAKLFKGDDAGKIQMLFGDEASGEAKAMHIAEIAMLVLLFPHEHAVAKKLGSIDEWSVRLQAKHKLINNKKKYIQIDN